jgi:hypothetical protein
MHRRSLSLLTALCLVGLASIPACKQEDGTIDVPFDGIDPVPGKKRDTASGVATESSAPKSDASTAAPMAGESNGAAGRPRSQGIDACCGELRGNAKAAVDEAAKANLTAAANACETQRRQLDEGKVTRAQALSAVRLSLLDRAPAACR